MELQISDDGSSWTTVETLDYNRNQISNEFSFNTVSASHVRLNNISVGRDDYTVAIAELEFFDTNNAPRIQHRPAKWYKMREDLSEAAKRGDTFNDEENMFLQTFEGAVGSAEIQAAHTYIDTIYMHKGSSITLTIPDRNASNNISSNGYQRWYNFRTDGLFSTGLSATNNVQDLLTPSGVSGTYYRLQNGYVGHPMNGTVTARDGTNFFRAVFYYPEDSEYEQWKGSLGQTNNDYYLVAVDLSDYLDFYDPANYEVGTASDFQRNGYYEPTLTHRALFYIVGVDDRDDAAWQSNGYSRLSQERYRGGGSSVDKSYLEEFDITFPVTRIMHVENTSTSELISLTKDAQSFAIPDAADDGNTLNISLVDNTAGIQLLTAGERDLTTTNRGSNAGSRATISGTNRRIFFSYPNSGEGNYGTQTVNDPADGSDPVATILVTKTVNGTTYNLARYRLTFKAETSLLTYSQLKGLESGTAGNVPWSEYDFRVPSAMDDNEELQLLTSLDFDNDDEVAAEFTEGHAEGFYPFPLEWGSSSYAFYDGSTSSNDFAGTSYTSGLNQYIPEFGYYSIMSSEVYITWNNRETITPNDFYPDKYHMYVDASERPGIIAQLPFEENLCDGSELYVTAWVRNANVNDEEAAMLFTIMGVSEGADGRATLTPIYRHCTGQIPSTRNISENIPGSNNNEWMQLYFSFINDRDEVFDSYVLQVENYCASTSGGDFDIDNIRVYIAQPDAQVTQLEATCTGEVTKMQIEMNWNRLASRLGIDEQTATAGDMDYIDICFFNVTEYERAVAEEGEDAAVARFGDFLEPIYGRAVEPESADEGWKVATISLHCDFESNTDYVDGANNWAFENNTNPIGHFYKQGTATESRDNRALLADFYSTLIPNYPYELLIMPRIDGDPATPEEFAAVYNDPCGINTEFRVTSDALLKVNGEVVRPDLTYCQGNIFNFSTQVRIPYYISGNPDEQYVTLDKGVYFDWFFGTPGEYTETNDTYGVSLRAALTEFRELYPDAEELSATETAPQGDFTQNHYDLINYYLTLDKPAGGQNHPLVLHRENLSITLLNPGLNLVLQPIPTEAAPEDVQWPEDAETAFEDAWLNVCWAYIPLALETTDLAPELHAGFNAVNYPVEGFNPNLRIGLQQIKDVATNNNDNKSLRIDLRGGVFTDDDVEYVSTITSVRGEEYDHIYLIETNDPAYAELLDPENGYTQYSVPIGTIGRLRSKEATEGDDDDYMTVTFDLGNQETDYGMTYRFDPKEGYYYVFAVHFEEYTRRGDAMGNNCFGTFPVRMDVVPEYLVWQGEATDNWNNDNNWRRANTADLNYGTEYVTNEENYEGADADTKASAYVPMLFSKVIIPAGKSVELYPAGFLNGANWTNSEKPDYIASPTPDIQYDLMVYESPTDGSFSTQRYRIALCDQIHFEPGAKMINSQYMLYNKAWVDVKLPARDWTNVSVPLEDVVAGDWYTQATGSDAELEYFSNLTKPSGSPSVYQRSWSTGATIVESGNTQTNVSYDEAVWSAAYNDASVPYTAGAGFSIRAKEGTNGQLAGLLFRLPKSEESYDVSTGAFDRADAGKLTASQLVVRNTDYKSATENDYFEVTLQPSKDGKYFIVGNPFVADMDVQRFLEANIDVLEQKYWLVADNGDPMTGVWSESSANWVTVDGTGKPVYVEPYRAFFVERKAGEKATGNVKVKFTKAMQNPNEQVAEEGTTTQGLSIEALGDGGRSTALVSFSGRADDGYAEGEDVQLVDFGSGATVPMVYSVAGQKAAAINRLSAAQQIPLGVYAPGEDEAVTLTFRGVGNLAEASLYDAETRTETPLTEGYELTVTGSSHGRYFLRAAGDFTSLDELPQDAATGVSVYSVLPGELIVATAGQRLEHVAVYDASGAQVFSSGTLVQDVCKAGGLQAGTYVVVVQAGGRTESHKIALQ